MGQGQSLDTKSTYGVPYLGQASLAVLARATRFEDPVIHIEDGRKALDRIPLGR